MAGEKVLVVDDRVENTEFIVDYVLKPHGYAHIAARDGAEGLRLARRERPDLMLLDMNMPKMNGIEFLKIMKTHPDLKTIPVIVLTTSKEQRDILGSFELGASGYMVKPVDYPKFVEILSRIMLYWSSSELPKQEFLLAEMNH